MNSYTSFSGNFLSKEGVVYFERWLESFENLTDEDRENLKQELPEKVFDFFDFTKKTTTVLSFLNQIMKISGNFS